MKSNDISLIIAKVILNIPLNETEEITFQNWVSGKTNKQLYDKIAQGESIKKILKLKEDGFGDIMARRFSKTLLRVKLKARIGYVLRYSVAAVFLILLTLATLNIFNQEKSQGKQGTNLSDNFNRDSFEDKVVLITPKGERIDLEKKSLEQILKIENQENKISELQKEPVYNIIIVPPKKEYNLTLPDGTKVWLNSGSRLSFPTVFSGSVRTVELEGEGYFDVVKDEEQHFLVKSKYFNTKVLGTKFMITSYEDNTSFELSLIEGSVDVTFFNNINHKIKPGEGVFYNISDGLISINEIDESKVLAKMSGYFVFNEMSLGDITNTLKRWYDIEFTFDDSEMREIKYFIETRKYENIEDIMLLLSNTKKIDYTILDKVVTIKKRNQN